MREEDGAVAGKARRGKSIKILLHIMDYLTGDITRSKLIGLLIYFTILSGLEMLAYLCKGVWSVLASRIWLITGTGCMMVILVYFMKTIIHDLKGKKYLAAASVLALVIMLFSIVGNLGIAEINPDATQQAAAGLSSFQVKDWNYTGKAFLGYPNRQYIIAALPSLLFGRSIFTLQLGFAYPFILGILILYCALRKWASRMQLDTSLAVLPLFALLVFPFITEYYSIFEQAIYPMSFTMIAIGFFLLLVIKPNLMDILCIAWIGCLLSNCYTPALAVLGLLAVFLLISACLWLKRPKLMPFTVNAPVMAAKAFFMVAGNIILFFVATILEKREDRITQIQKDSKWITTVYKGILDFLTDKPVTFLGMFGVLVLLYLIAGFTLQLKLRDSLITLWVLGVFAASFLLSGYTQYQPEIIMSRAMIVLPVIITAATLSAFDYIKSKGIKVRRGAFISILFTFIFIGLNNFKQPNQSFIYFNYVQPMKYMLSDLEKTVQNQGLEAESEFNLIIYTDAIIMQNPADYCSFFFPNASTYTPENGEFPADIDLSMPTFIYSEGRLTGNVPLTSPQEVVTYTNKKHEVTGTWYKGSITGEISGQGNK